MSKLLPGKKPNPHSLNASWVIIETATGKVIAETFKFSVANGINKSKYKAVPIYDYLISLNK